ncbi:MAG: hypothetical protein GXY44_13095 [Phycisphaerales bacterium]|nr:hypothetical protein [Phycisphaerales bacterium]
MILIRHLLFTLTIILSPVMGGTYGQVEACEGAAVRDAAFTGPRDIHRLCVMAARDDIEADRIYQHLEAWLRTDGRKLNIELHRADVNDTELDWLKEYGLPGAPPESPVTVLCGYRTMERRAFYIQYWQPEPAKEDLAALADSPLRERIRREIGSKMALLLYVKGTDEQAGTTEATLHKVAREWSEKQPLAVEVVELARMDEKESLLLAFSDQGPSGPEWVAVVFGRGKFMPPLAGEDITETVLNQQMEILIGDCACLRSPLSLGIDVPLKWESSMDTAATALRPKTDTTTTRSVNTPVDPIVAQPPSRRIFYVTTLYTAGGLVVIAVIVFAIIFRRKAD